MTTVKSHPRVSKKGRIHSVRSHDRKTPVIPPGYIKYADITPKQFIEKAYRSDWHDFSLEFPDELMRAHRSVQNEILRFMFTTMVEYAELSDNWGKDERNERAVEVSKAVAKLKEKYPWFLIKEGKY